MITPTARLLRLSGVIVVLAVIAAAFKPLLPGVIAVARLLLLAALVDALRVWRTPVPQVHRRISHALPLGHWRDLVLEVTNTASRSVYLQVFDRYPECADSEGLPATLELGAQQMAAIPARLRFHQRGDHVLAGTHLRYSGPFGLACRTVIAGEHTTVRVYPDFAAVARYALLATDNRLSQLGVRRRQRRGEGLEFRQLREYRPGDALRQIDWKATSRLRKLVSREYQDERDQQIVFLLDCGFRMRSQDGAQSHFDTALNALLLLSYVVLRQGDAAGCLTFADGSQYGGRSGRWLAPAKGRERMAVLMNTLFDLQPTHRTPDFRRLATDCAARLHKRSLIVLMTNLRDEDADDLIAGAQLLGERHLVLVATLRETVLDTLREQGDSVPVASASARLFLAERERALQRLKAAGLLVLDTVPEQLPVRLVNAYLEIKRSGRL